MFPTFQVILLMLYAARTLVKHVIVCNVQYVPTMANTAEPSF